MLLNGMGENNFFIFMTSLNNNNQPKGQSKDCPFFISIFNMLKV